jgi:hypothetical protein
MGAFLVAMTNKRTSDGDQPWWISSVYKVGIPAAIACYLIYFLVQKVDTKQDEIYELLKIHNNVMTQQMEEAKRQGDEVERSNRFLQQICFSVTASSRRQECFK